LPEGVYGARNDIQEARKRRMQAESAPQCLFGAHETDKDELTEEELSRMRADAEAYVASLVAAAPRRASPFRLF
jgi:hypothetical protein